MMYACLQKLQCCMHYVPAKLALHTQVTSIQQQQDCASSIVSVMYSTAEASVCSHHCTFIIVQGVGKSCLVLRYVRNQFDPSSKITVSSSNEISQGVVHKGHNACYEMWSCERWSRRMGLLAISDGLHHTG
jgi:hypothetical protein